MQMRRVAASVAMVMVTTLGSPVLAKTTITYMGGWGQDAGATGVSDFQLMQQLLDRFQRENPDIQVQWINGNDASKLASMIAAGTPPDVVYVYHPWVHAFAAQGAFLDLTPLIRRDANEIRSRDFFSGAMAVLSIKDKPFALPTWMASSGMYYNQDIFDAAGIAYPDESWTWNDLIQKGKKLTKVGPDNRLTQFAYTPDGYSFSWSTGPMIWVWSNGGDLISADESKFLLGSAQARQALEYYDRVIFQENISVSPPYNQQGWFYERFFDGQVAIWDSPSWNNTYLANVRFTWDVAPTMKSPFTGQRGAFIHTRGHAIAAASKHQEEAWRLVKFLSSPEVQALWAAQRGYQPTRASAVRAWLQFQPGGRKINLQPFIDSVSVARPIPNLSDAQKDQEFWRVITENWNRVLDRQLSVAGFLDTVTPLVQNILARPNAR